MVAEFAEEERARLEKSRRELLAYLRRGTGRGSLVYLGERACRDLIALLEAAAPSRSGEDGR